MIGEQNGNDSKEKAVLLLVAEKLFKTNFNSENTQGSTSGIIEKGLKKG